MEVTQKEMADEWRPPEGGKWGWISVAFSFISMSITFGIMNTHSILYVALIDRYEQQGRIDVSSTAALVVSLTLGVYFLLSPISGVLVDHLGHRKTAVLGGLFASFGFLFSSFFIDSPIALYFTYAIMYGGGGSLQVVSGIALMGLYFKRRSGLVNGIASTGAAVFSVVTPPIVRFLEPKVGLPGVLQVYAVLMLSVPFFAIALRPPDGMPNKLTSDTQLNKKLINRDNWKNRKFLVWCVSLPLAWFGFNILYVHLIRFAEWKFPNEDSNMLLLCLNVATVLCRVLLMPMGEIKKISNVAILQFALLTSGLLTIMLPVASSYWLVLAITFGLGFTDGFYITLLGPIAFQICGLQGGAQALGFIMGVSAIPVIAGPPIAGYIFDTSASYAVAFGLAGGATIVGGVIMTGMYFVRGGQHKNQNVINVELSEQIQPLNT